GPGRLPFDAIGISRLPSAFTAAPIENSPPGIQTIPSGALPGADASFGTVGANVAVRFTSAAAAAFAAVVAAANSAVREEPAMQHDFFSVVIGVWPSTASATSATKRKTMTRKSIEFILVLQSTHAVRHT